MEKRKDRFDNSSSHKQEFIEEAENKAEIESIKNSSGSLLKKFVESKIKTKKLLKIVWRSPPFNKNLKIGDISVNNKTKEDQIFLYNKDIIETLRHGTTICEFYQNSPSSNEQKSSRDCQSSSVTNLNNEKIQIPEIKILRKGLPKYFYQRESHLQFSESKIKDDQESRNRDTQDGIEEDLLILNKVHQNLRNTPQNSITIFQAKRANGECCHISLIKFGCMELWSCSNNSVSIICQNRKDIEQYDEQRFYYAKLIAKTWFDFLEIKSESEVVELKSLLEDHTLVGEYCGNMDLQHFVKYDRVQIVFYAIVNKFSKEPCQPLEQSFEIFNRFELDVVDWKVYRNYTDMNSIITKLREIYNEVESGSVEDYGEGDVIYFMGEEPTKKTMITLCKLRTLEGVFLKKIQEKAKYLVQNKVSAKSISKKFSAESVKLIGDKKQPKCLESYNRIYEKLFEIVETNKLTVEHIAERFYEQYQVSNQANDSNRYFEYLPKKDIEILIKGFDKSSKRPNIPDVNINSPNPYKNRVYEKTKACTVEQKSTDKAQLKGALDALKTNDGELSGNGSKETTGVLSDKSNKDKKGKNRNNKGGQIYKEKKSSAIFYSDKSCSNFASEQKRLKTPEIKSELGNITLEVSVEKLDNLTEKTSLIDVEEDKAGLLKDKMTKQNQDQITQDIEEFQTTTKTQTSLSTPSRYKQTSYLNQNCTEDSIFGKVIDKRCPVYKELVLISPPGFLGAKDLKALANTFNLVIVENPVEEKHLQKNKVTLQYAPTIFDMSKIPNSAHFLIINSDEHMKNFCVRRLSGEYSDSSHLKNQFSLFVNKNKGCFPKNDQSKQQCSNNNNIDYKLVLDEYQSLIEKAFFQYHLHDQSKAHLLAIDIKPQSKNISTINYIDKVKTKIQHILNQNFEIAAFKNMTSHHPERNLDLEKYSCNIDMTNQHEFMSEIKKSCPVSVSNCETTLKKRDGINYNNSVIFQLFCGFPGLGKSYFVNYIQASMDKLDIHIQGQTSDAIWKDLIDKSESNLPAPEIMKLNAKTYEKTMKGQMIKMSSSLRPGKNLIIIDKCNNSEKQLKEIKTGLVKFYNQPVRFTKVVLCVPFCKNNLQKGDYQFAPSCGLVLNCLKRVQERSDHEIISGDDLNKAHIVMNFVTSFSGWSSFGDVCNQELVDRIIEIPFNNENCEKMVPKSIYNKLVSVLASAPEPFLLERGDLLEELVCDVMKFVGANEKSKIFGFEYARKWKNMVKEISDTF